MDSSGELFSQSGYYCGLCFQFLWTLSQLIELVCCRNGIVERERECEGERERESEGGRRR